ncbi:hypothetical protein ACFLYR_07865, partial [Chloroflexota bacterium]
MPESEVIRLPENIQSYARNLRAVVSVNTMHKTEDVNFPNHVKGSGQKRGRKSNDVIKRPESGLLPRVDWEASMDGYNTELIEWLREELAKRIPRLSDSFNLKGKYFGFRIHDSKDRMYIYAQKNKLVIDILLPLNYKHDVEVLGFIVTLRQNFQGGAGWLTGWDIPFDLGWIKRREILQIILEAFRKD